MYDAVNVSPGWRCVICIIGLGVGIGFGTPRRGAAQDVVQDTLHDTLHDTSSTLPLPLARSVAAPPTVSAVGLLARTDSGHTSLMITATLAVVDLHAYDDQLRTQFPLNADYYPTDSIRQITTQRAQAWLARLETAGETGIGRRQLVDYAEVAFRAGRDSLARQLFDTRLAQLPTGHAGDVQRSAVLAAAVALLTDVTQDSARLANNLAGATTYATRLYAISAGGYSTKSDSTDVLYRQLESSMLLLKAADALGRRVEVIRHARQAWTYMERLDYDERQGAAGQRFPYREVAMAMIAQPNGRTLLDSLNAALLAIGLDKPTDVSSPPPQGRVGAADVWRQRERDRFASLALLGQPAPLVQAHAWLNTPDSSYAESPRGHRFDDGVVRILAFDDNDSWAFPVLQRITNEFPSGVQALLVTQTEGHVGPDIMTPREEVAWLSHYYHAKRRLTVPVALWAGEKIDGDFGMKRPASSTANRVYHTAWLDQMFVVVDGRGIVRGYEPARTRADEARIARRIQSLLQETRVSTATP